MYAPLRGCTRHSCSIQRLMVRVMAQPNGLHAEKWAVISVRLYLVLHHAYPPAHQETTAKDAALAEAQAAVSACARERAALVERRDALNDERKETWRVEAELVDRVRDHLNSKKGYEKQVGVL